MPTLLGTVSRLLAQKTVAVGYTKLAVHKAVGKILKKRVIVHAHDAQGDCQPGDKVLIQSLLEPITRTKKWAVIGIAHSAEDLAKRTGKPGAGNAEAARFRPVSGRRVEEIRLQLPRPVDRPRGSRVLRY